MKCRLIFLVTIFSFPSSYAQDLLVHQLERLNFFPKADAYLTLGFEHERVIIQGTNATIQTKKVNNYANRGILNYAHRLSRKLFIGAGGTFEEASENAVTYGVPLKRRFNSAGPKDIEIFTLYRLREQSGERGLIDLYMSFSPALGKREIGSDTANRLTGKDILRTGISHGLWEDEWEFRTALNVTYYDEGEEYNGFSRETYRLSSHYDVNLDFSAQYRFTPLLFGFGGIGVLYRSTEKLSMDMTAKREIQGGTGSLLRAGFKRPIDEWSLIELGYLLNRYDYFVKSDEANLEGDFIRQTLSLTYRRAF